MTDPFAAMGWTEEDVQAAKEAAEKNAPRRDGRVCSCGHPAKTHSSEGESETQKALAAYGQNRCRYGRMKCPCAKFDPILESNNVRSFTYKTTGPGPDHALVRGMAAAVSKGAEIEWLRHPKCAWNNCEYESEGKLTMVALNSHAKVSQFPESVNNFFCDAHVAALRA